MMRSGGSEVPGAATPVLVGRDAEVGRLAGLTRQVAAGRGAVVWVEGEPGIGKTTLLGVVAGECARLGVRVLRGGVEEFEQRLPFAAICGCLGARAGVGARSGAAREPEVARLAGLLRGERAFESSAAAANHELVVTEAVLELVDHWCASGPVALVVDDVQWADAASVVVLHRLGRAVDRDALPLLLVVAARPVPRGDAVAGLERSLAERGGQPLAVGPLPTPAVAGLVGHLVGARPGPRLLGLVAGAGGNPMYVAEVVAALGREGLVTSEGGVAEVAPDTADPAGPGGQRRRDPGIRQRRRDPGIRQRRRDPGIRQRRRDPAFPAPPEADRDMAAPPEADRDMAAPPEADRDMAAPPEARVLGSEWVPSSLVAAVQRRLGFLSSTVRETLEMAAVLGSAVDVAELSAVLGMPVGALSDVVAEAMAAGVLDEADGVLVFRHDVIRQALAGHRPAPVRTALRLRAGQVLAAAGAPVERVAGHLVAGTMLEPATVDWLVRSADALIVRAPEMAVLLLRRALAAAEGDMAGVLRFHLVRALLWAGEPVEAEHTASAALAAGPDPDRDGMLRWLLAQARYRQGRYWQGRYGDALAVAEEALGSEHLTPAEVGRFHGLISVCLQHLGRVDEVDAAAGRAVAAGEAGGDTVATMYGCTMLAVGHLARGELVQSLCASDRALSALEVDGGLDLEMVDPYVIRAYCLIGLDRLAEADEALTLSLRCNERAGAMTLPWNYAVRARLRFLDGRWDDALAEVQAGLAVPDPCQLGMALAPLAELVAVHRGAHPGGRAEAGKPVRYLGDLLVLLAAALAEEGRGEPRRALELLYPTWEKPLKWLSKRIMYDACPDLARLAAAVGDTDRLRELAATTEALAAREPSASMSGTALLCRGLAGADPASLLEAAGCFQDAGRPLYEGYGFEEAAVLLARRGSTAEARKALGGALALYADMEAAWDTARAQARLRQLGVRRGRRKALRRRPAHGWEALTETEHKVALLVAEGLSNPDIATKMFLSRRTVQSHVSSILTKLEVTSRVEVAVSAHQRETG